MDPRAHFPHFYDNDEIALLGTQARWTVSGQLDLTDEKQGRKAPIDLVHLIEHGRVRGAWALDTQCLVTLDELTEHLPTAANAAFYVQSHTDEVVVVDIEPGCPPEIAADLLNLPGIRYAELSMSGRGYHLLMNPPANRYQHPVAAGKRVLRHPQGWYEILFDHWVTFTRTPVPDEVVEVARERAPGEATSLEDVYALLAKTATAGAAGSAGDVITTAEPSPIAGGDQIVERTLEGARPRLKTPADFDHDLSRWEFSVLGILAREMGTHLVRVGFVNRTSYSAGDKAWLLYLAAREALPHRLKHEGQRNGRPYLLDRAAAMVAANSHRDLLADDVPGWTWQDTPTTTSVDQTAATLKEYA